MRLFDLSPIGLGTEHVESFYSYAVRLAHVHGVSLGRLVQEMKSDYESDETLSENYVSTSYLPWSPASMVRPTTTSKDIIAMFKHYTQRDDLRCTTFLALSQLKYRSCTFFSNSIRWCPCCLESDVEKGQAPYLRLVWFLNDVDYCHHHNVFLEHACHHCGSKQSLLGRRVEQSKCCRCKKLLSSKNRPLKSTELLRDVCFRDLIALVSAVSNDPMLEYHPSANLCLLHQIATVVAEIPAENVFWSEMSKDDSLYAALNDGPINLKNLRRIAYRLGISLPRLLAGDMESWIPQLNPEWLTDLPENLRPPKRRKLVDREMVVERLTAVLSSVDNSNPPSLASVARIVGISTGGLEYLHPMACREIKRNYKNWLDGERARKYSEARVEVLKYLGSDEPCKSRKHALRTIRAKVDLPKNVLLEVISAEYR